MSQVSLGRPEFVPGTPPGVFVATIAQGKTAASDNRKTTLGRREGKTISKTQAEPGASSHNSGTSQLTLWHESTMKTIP